MGMPSCQVVEIDGLVLEKPSDAVAATEMLKRYNLGSLTMSVVPDALCVDCSAADNSLRILSDGHDPKASGIPSGLGRCRSHMKASAPLQGDNMLTC